jgi:hypothetical protein
MEKLKFSDVELLGRRYLYTEWIDPQMDV